MREFIGSALVVVLVSGTLAVPLALVVARLAMNPPDVAAFVRRLLSLEPMRVVARPAVLVIGVGVSPHAAWAETTAVSRLYQRVEKRGAAAFPLDGRAATSSAVNIRLIAV